MKTISKKLKIPFLSAPTTMLTSCEITLKPNLKRFCRILTWSMYCHLGLVISRSRHHPAQNLEFYVMAKNILQSEMQRKTIKERQKERINRFCDNLIFSYFPILFSDSRFQKLNNLVKKSHDSLLDSATRHSDVFSNLSVTLERPCLFSNGMASPK